MSKRTRKGGKVKPNEAKQTAAKGEVPVKGGTKVLADSNSAGPASPPAAEAAPQRPLKIKVLKADMVYKGNRLAWYNRLKEFEGKTEGEFLADAKARPPSLTRNGTTEPPTGWVGFFKRQGVLSLTM